MSANNNTPSSARGLAQRVCVNSSCTDSIAANDPAKGRMRNISELYVQLHFQNLSKPATGRRKTRWLELIERMKRTAENESMSLQSDRNETQEIRK
ncbi:MAG TPA: hypothetical protein VGM98_10145 [Schlesneria sp.]